MKVKPIMDNQSANDYSNMTQTYDFAYPSPMSMAVEELQHPVAKTINVLSPVNKKQTISVSSSSSDFEPRTANKIYTKELVSSHSINFSRCESRSSYGASTFDQDKRECQIAEKVNRLKAEGTNATAKASSKPSEKRAVQFSRISIQEYSLQPGINPGGSKGCPLTIGWEVIGKDDLDLDAFESLRSERRRRGDQLKLVSDHREQMLRRMGYSMREIMDGEKAANQTRRARFNTISRLKSTDSQEKLEGIQRNVKHLVTFGSKKRREQKLLAPYQDENKTPNNNNKTKGFRLPKLVSGKSKLSSAARVFVEDDSKTSIEDSIETFSF